ncbi:hypothetical protein Psed_6820 (plasmid) [Pseudonocardia dioxanivorans CB1190]|uniref:DUF4192 domain-containing protein n=1 Tax=Pseudonocardia dioxanivorans (strain ATCC 55486 / DSM 44775 / JCM 13855 / CB1190) TaxID=675635 RepID=F2L6J7_PSEUX|nr:DUF4192 family protein [Pseudonocardia dioxanivorans]AEA28891.1 hypothetical protein Psed_6820 [Pseudonocardia dioxanivorans CB1190]
MTVPAIRLTAHGDLVSTVGALLGYHPANSLVLLAFGTGISQIGPVIRADLPPAREVEVHTARMLAMVPPEYQDHAILVTVSTLPREDAARDASLVLTAAGVRVTASVHTAGTRPGDRWSCLDPGCAESGTVPAPPAELAARLAWHGRPTLDSREALDQALAPGDPETLARRAHLLAADACPEVPGVGQVVDDYLAHRVLDDDRVLALVAAMADQRGVVEQLRERSSDLRAVLEALVPATPAPWSAHPAAYLALAALLHGDGAHAVAAATRATRADPTSLLAQLVSAVAGRSPSPDTVRRLLTRF